ncbi:MAG: hypothetical protein ACM3XO_16275 [Bacteroidota bacterium]
MGKDRNIPSSAVVRCKRWKETGKGKTVSPSGMLLAIHSDKHEAALDPVALHTAALSFYFDIHWFCIECRCLILFIIAPLPARSSSWF